METQGNGQLPAHRCPPQHPNPRHAQRARASPPPDPEMGNGYHYSELPPPPHLTAEAMQPPRLQGQGCCGKMIAIGACCICVSLLLVVWTAFLSIPAVIEARTAITDRIKPEAPPPKRPLPAILRRYGMIKRAKPPGRGADPVSLALAFPHWRAEDGSIVLESVVNDFALGLAAVAEQMDPAQELRIVTAGASPPPEPPPPIPPSDEDELPQEL